MYFVRPECRCYVGNVNFRTKTRQNLWKKIRTPRVFMALKTVLKLLYFENDTAVSWNDTRL